jgi:Ca2+-binding RTX toxin-like protein
MRRIGTSAVMVLLATGGGLAGAAAQASAPAPTCAGKRATIVDPSKGNDRIVGTSKRDVIVAGRGKGRDVVLGLDGDDLVCGDARTRVLGGRGDDTVHDAGSADGGKGADRFHGVGTARGGRGADTYWAPMGTGSFDGGAGHDRVVFYEGYVPGTTSGVYVNLALGLASAEAEVGSLRMRTALAGIEEVRGTPDDDLVLGDALDNVLRGGDGNDVLNGRAGADTVIGGGGKDTCTGEVRRGCER